VFGADQCIAPFSFRYQHLDSDLSLVIKGIVYIDDDGSAMIGTLRGLSNQEKSESRRRMELAGINPDTLETISHNVEISQRVPYLDYLKALMPQQRRDAIFELSRLESLKSKTRCDESNFSVPTHSPFGCFAFQGFYKRDRGTQRC